MARVIAIFLINVFLFCSACLFLQCSSVSAAASPGWGLAGHSHPVPTVTFPGPEQSGSDLGAAGHGLRGRACAGSGPGWSRPRSVPAARPWPCSRSYWRLPSLIQGRAPCRSGRRGPEAGSGPRSWAVPPVPGLRSPSGPGRLRRAAGWRSPAGPRWRKQLAGTACAVTQTGPGSPVAGALSVVAGEKHRSGRPCRTEPPCPVPPRRGGGRASAPPLRCPVCAAAAPHAPARTARASHKRLRGAPPSLARPAVDAPLAPVSPGRAIRGHPGPGASGTDRFPPFPFPSAASFPRGAESGPRGPALVLCLRRMGSDGGLTRAPSRAVGPPQPRSVTSRAGASGAWAGGAGASRSLLVSTACGAGPRAGASQGRGDDTAAPPRIASGELPVLCQLRRREEEPQQMKTHSLTGPAVAPGGRQSATRVAQGAAPHLGYAPRSPHSVPQPPCLPSGLS